MNLVKMDISFAKNLFEKCEAFRPEFRKTTFLDPDIEFAVLMDNFLTDENLTVEIKPKWGLLCDGDKRCKFCRLQPTRPYPIGDYCPSKLFSGDINEIGEALAALEKTPRNQLRLYEGHTRRGVTDGIDWLPKINQILFTDPLLNSIKSAHQMLLGHSKNALHVNYEVEAFLQRVEKCIDDEAVNRDPLVSFLTAMSLEDLTIIVSIDRLQENGCKIMIVDLDIKSPKKLPFYLEECDDLSDSV